VRSQKLGIIDVFLSHIIIFDAVKAVILITLIILPVAVNAQKLKNLQRATDSSYGFTLNNPIIINMGSTQKSEVAVYNYINGIKRLNGETLQVLSRTTATNPKYKKKQDQEDMLKRMKAGEQVNILIDVYKLETLIKNDTITLYIDMYGKGDPKVPVGYEWSE
jgi:hypothetical protein